MIVSADIIDSNERRSVGERDIRRADPSMARTASRPAPASSVPPELGVETVAQPVADDVHRQHEHDEGDRGEQRDPPDAREHELVADADQRAERGIGRRHADAEERQRRLGQHRGCQVDRRDDEHGAHHVGQDVAHHDPARRQADDLGGLHILLRQLHHRGGADGARILHPFVNRDGADEDDRRPLAVPASRKHGARDAADQQGEQDGRQAQDHVADPHDRAHRPSRRNSRRSGRARRRRVAATSTAPPPMAMETRAP